MSILFVILGIILVISPESSINTIAYMLASFLLVYGTFNFIDSFTINPIFFFMKMASSAISIILGIVIFLNPDIFIMNYAFHYLCNDKYKSNISDLVKLTLNFIFMLLFH